MMKNFKKLLCLSLAVLMLLAVLAGCNKDAQGGPDGQTADAAGSSAAAGKKPGDSGSADVSDELADGWETDINGFVLDKIENVDLGGKEIRILTGSDRMESSYVDSSDMTTPIKTAVFSRNQAVQVRLKCRLNYIPESDVWADASAFTQKAISLATTQEVDMFNAYSMISTSLMINGVLTDLLSNDILHFDAPWWNSKMVDTCTLYDRMYFCTGDIAYDLLSCVISLRYNKSMAADVGLEEYLKQTYDVETLYDLVRSGDWTLDNMMTICKQFYVDNDGTKTGDDKFGFVATVIAMDAFWAGSDLQHLERGSDGSVNISADMEGQKASDLTAKLVDFMKHPSTSVYTSFSQATNAQGNGIWEWFLWKGQQSLMYMGGLGNLLSDEIPFESGVLPMPKYDKDQEEYLTCTGFTYGIWGVTRNSTAHDDLFYVLECLASESYRKVTPVFFDQSLLGRQDTANDYEMLKLIRDSVMIDGGRVMTKAFDEWTYYVFRGALVSGIDYLGYYEKREQALKDQAAALNTLVLNMEQLYGSN